MVQMPSVSNKPTYLVSTLVVVSLILLGLGVQGLRRLIPDPEVNALANVPGDFYKQANRQRVPWQVLGPDAFATARRLDKPIFLMMGGSWSRLGRIADAGVFVDSDVVEKLRQSFVPVRVDLSRMPHYMAVVFPIEPRGSEPFDFGFQVYVLDPEGNLVDALLRRPSDAVDPALLLAFLRQADATFAALRGSNSLSRAASAQMQQQSAFLMTPRGSRRPAFEEHSRKLASQWASPAGDVRSLDPAAWRFTARMGEVGKLRQILDAVAESYIVDWLDGGFFRYAGERWTAVQYDKLATTNADVMLAFAQGWALFDEPLYAYLAKRTFEALDLGFGDSDLIRTASIGRTMAMNRSPRSSFSPRLLREVFGAGERAWLRENFGLRVEDNSQMIMRLANREAFYRDRTRLDSALAKLREARQNELPVYCNAKTADVNGVVVARMLETARLVGEQELLARADTRFKSLRPFRTGPDDVLHLPTGQGGPYAYLTDYLGYADAALQHYLVFGNPSSLRDGAAVLERAIELFGSEMPGVIYHGPPEDPDLGMNAIRCPQVVDGPTEASMARAIRLLFAYGSLLNKPEFTEVARQGISNISWIANGVPLGASSFFDAALSVNRGAVAFVTGPKAGELMRRMLRRRPYSIIAFPGEGVWEELRTARPGIYIVRNRQAQGPLGLSAAVTALAGDQGSP